MYLRQIVMRSQKQHRNIYGSMEIQSFQLTNCFFNLIDDIRS